MSDAFVKEAKEWLSKGTCEIGVHLHAWNNPPIHELAGLYHNNPYSLNIQRKLYAKSSGQFTTRLLNASE